MRVLALGLVAVLALGCSAGTHLLTTAPVGGGCYTSGAQGLLSVDPKYGTVIVDEVMTQVTGVTPSAVPVAWRPGFTGRQVGSEIEVLAPDGHVVAVTGRSYRLEGGYTEVSGVSAFWSCGAVDQQ